jgi:hypothetical protein
MNHKYLNIDWDKMDQIKKDREMKEKIKKFNEQQQMKKAQENQTQTQIIYDRPLRYFIAPSISTTNITYQNVNKDQQLRKIMTEFYQRKLLKWIENYKDFSHLKKISPLLKSDKGYNLVYNLLRKFVHKNDTNWFDLKDQYDIIKDYLKINLSKLS